MRARIVQILTEHHQGVSLETLAIDAHQGSLVLKEELFVELDKLSVLQRRKTCEHVFPWTIKADNVVINIPKEAFSCSYNKLTLDFSHDPIHFSGMINTEVNAIMVMQTNYSV